MSDAIIIYLNRLIRILIKAKIIDKIKRSLDAVDNHTFIDTYKIMAELLQEMGQDIILHKTI